MDPTDPASGLIISASDLQATFERYDRKYFYGKLGAVKVTWNGRLTKAAGNCHYKRSSNSCKINLSEKLLKQRPRKDFKDTLLHEMIHAYLFLTEEYSVSKGHGRLFKKHMKRINEKAGTNITVYHSFHTEVASLKQHWWRCDGPCRKMKPKYGFVKRATNRAPCPSDFSWKKHQEICGGKYTKVSPVPPYAPLDQPKPTNDENVPLQIPASVPKKAESVNTPVPEPKKKRASPVPTAIIKGGVTKKKASPEKKRTSPPLEKRLPSKKSTKSPPVIDILDDTPPGPTRFPVKPYSPPSSNSPPLVPYEVSSDEDDLEVVQKRLSSMKLSSTSTPKAMPKNTSTIAGFTKVLSKKPSHPVIDLTDDTPTTSTRQIRMPRPKILIVPDNDGIEILSEKIVSRKPEIEVVNDSAKRGR